MGSLRAIVTGMLIGAISMGPWSAARAHAEEVAAPVWEKLFCKTPSSSTMSVMPCPSGGQLVYASGFGATEVGEFVDLQLHGSLSQPRSVNVDVLAPDETGKLGIVPVTYAIERQAFSAKVQSSTCSEPTFAAGVMYSIKAGFSDGSSIEYRTPVVLENRSNISEARSSGMALADAQTAEDGVYPPGMKKPIAPYPTVPGIDPDTLPPSNNFIIIYPNMIPMPTQMDEGAKACWLQYLADCRAAQTEFKTKINNIGTNDSSDAASGAAVGGVVGGIGGIIGGYVAACVVGGPIGAVAWTIVLAGSSSVGAVIFAGASVAGGDQRAIEAAKNDLRGKLDDAWAAYIKCLIGKGFTVL